MRPARQQGDPVREVFFYDHDEQVAIDAKGRYLTVEAATANKVTSSDGVSIQARPFEVALGSGV
jgi:hypothetical protein